MQGKDRIALPSVQQGADLAAKIHNRTAKLGVIGLGSAGLSLILEMAKAGFHATGIDMDREKVESINAGISYVDNLPSETLFSFVAKERIRATQALAAVEEFDAVSICVPTPVGRTKEPDLSYVIAAVEAVRNHLRPGRLIVLEGSIYPGATREVVLPILEASSLEVGKDFFLAYSSVRDGRHDSSSGAQNMPKIVGGITPLCGELAALLYRQFIRKVVPVSSLECAEMVDLLEDSFLSVNIALANETALMCQKLGIDIWEVIDAAKSKPFGFMAFYPRPGLWGSSVPAEARYLIWKTKMNGSEPRLIELAATINSHMPNFLIARIADALNEKQKSLKGSKILVLGITHGRDGSDIPESPAVEMLRGLQEKGALVLYNDPYVPSLEINGETKRPTKLTPELLRSMNCVVVLNGHACFDYAMIVTHSPLVLDCGNALKNFSRPNLLRF